MRNVIVCLLVFAVGSQTPLRAEQKGTPAPADAEVAAVAAGDAIPDLQQGEGPAPEKVRKAGEDWFLHFYGTRGWIHGHVTAQANRARQILITHVPPQSAVRHQIQVGDVILGVNGKPFDRHPVYQFRESSLHAQQKDEGLTLTMWRKGWEAPRTLDIEPRDPRPDFTQGDTIDLTQKDMPVDRNLGATGARGWIYGNPLRAHQILITKVHEGSPAEGLLKEGDVIVGVGDTLFTTDARKAFGMALTEAETREGRGQLKLLRWRDGVTEPVTLQLDVMGSYSATTPWDCEKSRKILERACAYTLRNGVQHGGVLGIPAIVRTLGLMATGNAHYMPVVREHVYALVDKVAESGDEPPVWSYPSWGWGYANLLLSEYYLLTREETVLPAIRKYSSALALGQAVSGTWGHGMAPNDTVTGKPHGALGGYGTMNQISTICWTSLVLAKRCGVTDPEIELAIANGHKFLSYFIDIGTVTYGDNLSGGLKHDDNGKTSAAAVGFAAFGDEAGTRFCSRMTVASHDVREEGHTGNYWSFLWGALGAARAGQEACAAFLHQDSWRYDLERRFDGGFEYQGKIGMGNGVDPETGIQRAMSEHTTPHWDTTGARILMYCLPRKQLVITGRDILTTELSAAEASDAIDAGSCPAGIDLARKYDHDTPTQLLKRLGSWSPVVRVQAAKSLAGKEGDPVPALRAMLASPDRYVRYGACTGLQHLGTRAQPAVADLVALLDTEDRVLRIRVIQALGTTDDMRAVEALFEMAQREFPADTYSITYRYIAEALFGRVDSLVEKARTVEDRELLLGTTQRFLRSVTGHCRTIVADNMVDALSPEDIKRLWGDLDHAFYTPATTYNTAIQLKILRLMAAHHVKEGIDRCVWYLTNMRGHGSEKRVPEVLEILLEYNVHATYTIPQLRDVADYFENREQDFPKNLSLQKAEAVRETIRKLEAMTEQDRTPARLISIAEGWK